VPFKLVKDMEDLIKEQHERVTELKQKLAEMFDENSTLVTQNKILNERVTNQVDFDIDLSKYQDNLLQ
jgi:regulator of replication initiation timing